MYQKCFKLMKKQNMKFQKDFQNMPLIKIVEIKAFKRMILLDFSKSYNIKKLEKTFQVVFKQKYGLIFTDLLSIIIMESKLIYISTLYFQLTYNSRNVLRTVRKILLNFKYLKIDLQKYRTRCQPSYFKKYFEMGVII